MLFACLLCFGPPLVPTCLFGVGCGVRRPVLHTGYKNNPYNTTVAMGSNTALVDLTLKVDKLSRWTWSGPDIQLSGPPRTETDTNCCNHTAPVLIARTSAQTRWSCLSVDQRTCSAARLQADRNTQLAGYLQDEVGYDDSYTGVGRWVFLIDLSTVANVFVHKACLSPLTDRDQQLSGKQLLRGRALCSYSQGLLCAVAID
jgi:hypothetical protein